MLIGWVGQVILGMGTRFDGRTLIAGLLGSFVGGLLASLIAGDGLHLRLSGLIGSIIGAIIVAGDLAIPSTARRRSRLPRTRRRADPAIRASAPTAPEAQPVDVVDPST
jgi:uncharacterized membrane protein YeaQ/YmgE (transglycosylase-associated protein family)